MIHRIDPAQLGPLLKRLRINQGLSLDEAAFELGLMPITLRHMEWGSTSKSLARYVDLLSFYGCCVKIEVYEPPEIETLSDMVEALYEIGYGATSLEQVVIQD